MKLYTVGGMGPMHFKLAQHAAHNRKIDKLRSRATSGLNASNTEGRISPESLNDFEEPLPPLESTRTPTFKKH